MTKIRVKTSFGSIAIEQTHGTGLPVFLLHGNSACKEVFTHQLLDLGGEYAMFAVDLPGHGQSDNALDPADTYTIPGYADVVFELAKTLGLNRFAVYGWSLGGHIAIEMMARSKLVGVAIGGTPPVGTSILSLLQGYKITRLSYLIGKESLTDWQCQMFTTAIGGKNSPAYLFDAVRRTHGLARSTMLQGVKSRLGIDQKKTVETSNIPLAIINGADDNLIRHKYIASLPYKNLWRDEIQTIANAGHAPFLHNPDEFNMLLSDFLDEAV